MRKKEEATNEKIIDAGGSEIAGKRNAEQLESEHKKHRAWKIGILIVLVFAAVAYVIGTRWEYKGYKVVESNQTDYSNTASYIRFSDNLLKYTPDGVSYINAKGETVWTTGINMKVPVAVASGGLCGGCRYERQYSLRIQHIRRGKQPDDAVSGLRY